MTDSLKAKYTSIITEKDKIISSLQENLTRVQNELSIRPSIDEVNKLKVKLQALEAVQYGVDEDNDEIIELDDQDLKDVNNVLKQKVKKLENELTHIKVTNSELNKRVENVLYKILIEWINSIKTRRTNKWL